MACPPYNDTICELQYLIDGLTGWNLNSFLEVIVASIAGALFAFFGTLYLRSKDVQGKKEARTRAAVVDFMKWYTSGGMEARQMIDSYNHIRKQHPDDFQSLYPQGRPRFEPFVELAETERLFINTSGKVHELAAVLRNALHEDDQKTGEIAFTFWPAFNDVASGVLEGAIKEKDAVREMRARVLKLRAPFSRRFDTCGLCAASKRR